MTNDLMTFEAVSRDFWKGLHETKKPLLSEAELESIKSLNDNINIQDVIDIYLPLISLIQIYKNNQENLLFSKSLFLKREISKRPFIIGISGSVAVGKSTTSRLLQLLLSRSFKESKVEMVTTDGFLYPNQYLIQHNILNRKGFPESYNMELLLNFLDTMRDGGNATIPVYSHEIYDIIPNQEQDISCPDFLIIEGINIFQNLQNNNLYMTDYFDFSIYIDANSQLIESWYLERFESLLNIAQLEPENYYHRFLEMGHDKAMQLAKDTWKTINLVNLENYIAPTRHRADLIMHKTSQHKIDEIYLKK
ncbi:pantothenate kinase [Streptococcus urinalis FB127-CNA-2]|uniref:Pantothenate kinase n=1 Tax=Streptococcus urinalis 2285-97 TaxID=764291 RepID=G5KG95_9STRE|nr:type I pantothenate kinase [Streptococcus urinalis]EHJ57731.1 pantothenate kinase [Streptococcus urinalis 2285-97]EKS22305.1 pantothenate kinase [Streptococcus urinalis FB127-CNA-2]VEF32117.1 pantothenate kinase [Streptococcus urinalis]